MSARHLRLVPNQPAGGSAAPPAKTPREAVLALSQQRDLELFDALDKLVSAHDDPDAALQELEQLRRNILHVTDFVFTNVAENCLRRRTQQAAGAAAVLPAWESR